MGEYQGRSEALHFLQELAVFLGQCLQPPQLALLGCLDLLPQTCQFVDVGLDAFDHTPLASLFHSLSDAGEGPLDIGDELAGHDDAVGVRVFLHSLVGR